MPSSTAACRSAGTWNGFPDNVLLWLVGILASAFAISFGARVWNDLLKALLGVRSRMRSSAPGKQ